VNYTELAQAIRGFTENDFPASVGAGEMSSDEQVDRFIRLAEQRIYTNAPLLPAAQKSTAVLTTTADDPLFTLPADWLLTDSLTVTVAGVYYPLLYKEHSFFKEVFPASTYTGVPQYYAQYDDTRLLLAPTPDDAYDTELDYVAYPESIVDAGTSWLGDNHDQVLLYGALLEAATYMQADTDVMTNYQKRFTEAMTVLKSLYESSSDQFRPRR
jgi:hypothetical protein